MRGRIDAPLRREGEEARHGQTVERLIPGPAGIGDDLRDQAIEVDFPSGGDASRVASEASAARRPAALARAGKA